ncbi:MAG: NgoFVII family restriction endonuclease [Clostridia bacterium]|nr:NgoFVII family restriction endonuclease [Clostridia bacterium]
MEILYSNILPLGINDSQKTVKDGIEEEFSNADKVDIAVGYISRASLEQLEQLVTKCDIKNVRLVIGMYFYEGMPESSYHIAIAINDRWKYKGIGEIRIANTFKYHGKLYCFSKNGQPFSSVLGSANLGVLKPEAANRRQYEIACKITQHEKCRELSDFVDRLATDQCSANIAEITNMPLIREVNTSLSGIELVKPIPMPTVDLYAGYKTETSFILPLKVPSFADRMIDDNRHFTKSNINVCYAAPRSKRKARDWFETQLTVSKSITRLEGYPEKNSPFWVITDDGYEFKAHTTSDGNKQFSAVGDELILGRWIKGRLAAAGLVLPVNNTKEDTERLGMITKEMLEAYGCDELVLTKTTQTAPDDDGNELEVWLLEFDSAVRQ